MNYEHPTIKIECPLPGHYCISGHRPQAVFVPDLGHLVPPGQVYLPPELPDEALLAVLEDRRTQRSLHPEATTGDETTVHAEPKPKRAQSARHAGSGASRRPRPSKLQTATEATV